MEPIQHQETKDAENARSQCRSESPLSDPDSFNEDNDSAISPTFTEPEALEQALRAYATPPSSPDYPSLVFTDSLDEAQNFVKPISFPDVPSPTLPPLAFNLKSPINPHTSPIDLPYLTPLEYDFDTDCYVPTFLDILNPPEPVPLNEIEPTFPSFTTSPTPLAEIHLIEDTSNIEEVSPDSFLPDEEDHEGLDSFVRWLLDPEEKS